MAGFDTSEMGLDEPSVAGWAKQGGGGEVEGGQVIQDVTAHKPGGACDQNFQSDQAEFLANFAELIEGEIDLGVGVSGHQANADQFVAGTDGG